MSDSLDGEVAMKNLEAAQVADSYRRMKRSTEKNPLLRIPQDKAKDIITAMKTLNDEFTNLQKAYEDYKNSMVSDVKGMENEVDGEEEEEISDDIGNDVEQAEGEEEEEISGDIENYPEQAEGGEEEEISDDIGNDVEPAEGDEEENANEEVTEYDENEEEPYEEDEQEAEEKRRRRR